MRGGDVRGYEGQVEIVLLLRQSQAQAGAGRRGGAPAYHLQRHGAGGWEDARDEDEGRPRCGPLEKVYRRSIGPSRPAMKAAYCDV